MTEVAQRVTDWESVVRELNRQVSDLERKLEAANETIELIGEKTPQTDTIWEQWERWLYDICKSPHAISAVKRFKAYLTRQNIDDGE